MRRLLIVARASALLVHVIAGLLVEFAIFPLVGARTRAALIRAWARLCLTLCGLRLEVRTLDGSAPVVTRNGCLWVANHISWLDVMVINAIAPAHFIAKSEVRRWPMIGMLVARSGTIFIERGRRRAVHDVIRTMVKRLHEGEPCAVFPEGTTSDGVSLLPFHANLMEAAIEAAAPIQAVSLRYLDHGQPTTRAAYVGDQTLLDSMGAVLGAPGLTVMVTLAPRLHPPHLGKRHELADRTRGLIAAGLGLPPDTMSSPPP